jgi:two-component system sensor histidine kinase HydH
VDQFATRTQIPLARLNEINRLVTVARLLSAAVHDVSNSLQVVSGNGELIDRQPGNAEQVRLRARTITTHADRASSRLVELVDMLNEVPGLPQRVDVADVIARIVACRKSTLGRAHAVLSVDLPPEPPRVRAHAGELLRLLINLVLNAEAAVRGRPGARIAIAARCLDPEHVEISVGDNGAGIPPERHPGLFKPLSGEGGGLGLCVGRYLAERQGGTLDLDPATPVGARFVVVMPAAS